MDVFDLKAKIGLDKSEYESGIEDVKSSGSSLASTIGKGLKIAGAAVGAAIGAAATGVSMLTKMSVEGYAQYEQLTGGVETLFKKSGDAVMKYAENAYKTSGLSANAYMETVTSFSASLIQSLDGDTAKAADVADQAITDMADNANKMGTSIEMIQNAYNGFAKGNFTMLDNLKLGYGGTGEEMKRLLKDAEAISGIKYDISSFADITAAIHVMQQEMGIAGATAAEAATTIEGSLGMMKGAWQNLVVGMADENANMESLIAKFVESTVTVADNIAPRVEQALIGIGQLVEGIAPVIAEKLPGLVESILPALLNAAVSLVNSVVSALPGLLNTLLPVVISAAFDILNALVLTIQENGGLLLQTGIDAVMQLLAGIAEMLPEVIAAAVAIIADLVNTMTSPESLNELLDTAMVLIENIVIGLIDNLPKLVDAAIKLVQNLVDFITAPGNLEKVLNMCVTLVLAIMEGLIDAIPVLVDAAIEIVMQLIDFLLAPGNIGMLIEAALEIVLAIAGGLVTAAVELVAGATELIGELIGTFTETDWSGVGSDIIDGLWSGLKSAWTNVSSWFGGVWDALFNRSVNVSSDGSGGVSVKGYATGLNYVPYDEFPAILHRGEAVLTAAEARDWRNGRKTPAAVGGVTINQYIQSVPQTPVEMAAATNAYFEQARWAL